jgi:hypothetical protein
MNLLEHYIKKIIKEEKCEGYGEIWVDVLVEVNCYGSLETVKHTTSLEEWQKEKEQGYFFA